MKVCYLGNAQSVHLERWARYFQQQGWQVTVLSLTPGKIEGVRVVELRVPARLGRWSYILALPQIKRVLRESQPDLVHAHYASSYGVLGVIAGWRPLVLSGWGSDICSFPRKSPLHAALLRFALAGCDQICATSPFLASEASRHADGRDILITPFGVDCERFAPRAQARKQSPVVVGTVRNLETVYGIDVLITAFAEAVRAMRELRLVIVGDGSQRGRLEKLARKLGLDEDQLRFIGGVPHKQVPDRLAEMDIFVMPSVGPEAFGVAALEASACGLPVIASDIGGLRTVVEDGATGLLVPPGDPGALAKAMLSLARNPALRELMGLQGTQFVRQRFEWHRNAAKMAAVYQELLAAENKGQRRLDVPVRHPC